MSESKAKSIKNQPSTTNTIIKYLATPFYHVNGLTINYQSTHQFMKKTKPKADGKPKTTSNKYKKP